MKNALSFPAEIQYKAIPSKCDLKIEVWSKQEGRHQRAPILSCFVWFEPPWLPPLPQMLKSGKTSSFWKSQILTFFFYENGHISGTVRPTSLQHPSNRSPWLGRPENHLRWSLTCPGNTGEPEAPVLGSNRHIELGPEAKKWLRQKGQFFGLLCPQTQICWGRTSKIFDLAPWEPLLDAPFLS